MKKQGHRTINRAPDSPHVAVELDTPPGVLPENMSYIWYVIAADGSHPQAIAINIDGGKYSPAAVWSPNSRYLALSGVRAALGENQDCTRSKTIPGTSYH